jgi:hypothetical protein
MRQDGGVIIEKVRGEIVRQKLTMFAQVLGIGLLLSDSGLGIAAPDAVPKLNTRPTCESPTRAALFPDKSVEACLGQVRKKSGLIQQPGRLRHGGLFQCINLRSWRVSNGSWLCENEI